jgi:UDP-N-acetylmuramoyl-tripeptide--D-alanyl-D-alanine ligase
MFTLADLIEGLTGRRPSDAAQPIRRFVIDSREGGPGDVFVAFRGEQTDGHLYVGDAFGRGVVAAIVEQDVPLEALLLDLRHNVTQRAIKQWTLPVIFRVDNSLAALQELAKWWRMRLKDLRVIGITGSVGKSSTKELIATVLEHDFVVLKSEGNLNNEIGLPLTLLQLEPRHQRAVLEMGMYARGEIARLA